MTLTVTPGLGTKLQLSISSVFTDIAQVVSISGPNWTVGSSPTTHLGSTAQTSRPTLPDGGEVTFQILYWAGETTHAALTTLAATPVISSWKEVFADTGAAVWAFDGYLTAFQPTGMTAEETVVADVTIKLNGIPTITP